MQRSCGILEEPGKAVGAGAPEKEGKRYGKRGQGDQNTQALMGILEMCTFPLRAVRSCRGIKLGSGLIQSTF